MGEMQGHRVEQVSYRDSGSIGRMWRASQRHNKGPTVQALCPALGCRMDAFGGWTVCGNNGSKVISHTVGSKLSKLSFVGMQGERFSSAVSPEELV